MFKTLNFSSNFFSHLNKTLDYSFVRAQTVFFSLIFTIQYSMCTDSLSKYTVLNERLLYPCIADGGGTDRLWLVAVIQVVSGTNTGL